MRRLLLAALPALVVASACGGASESGGESTPSTDVTAPTATEAPAVTTESTTTTTTTEAPPQIVALTAADVPDVIRAWEDADGTPLELARSLTGFPLEVPMPDDTTPWRVAVDLNARDPEGPWVWGWSYHATTDALDGAIDIAADDMGPAAAALRERYDPILEGLGWRYSNTTGSDPSSGGGGPEAVNHVYRSTTPTVTVGDVEATPRSLFVWADEELIFGEGVPGYQIDVDLEMPPGTVPVPLISLLIDSLLEGGAPLVTVDDRLVAADLKSFERPPDSFDAPEGLRYLDLDLDWELAAGSGEAHRSAVAAASGDAIVAGEEGFFDPGFIESVEPTVTGDRWTQPVVVFERYPGSFEIIEDPSTGVATMTLDVRFEANRELLRPIGE